MERCSSLKNVLSRKPGLYPKLLEIESIAVPELNDAFNPFQGCAMGILVDDDKSATSDDSAKEKEEEDYARRPSDAPERLAIYEAAFHSVRSSPSFNKLTFRSHGNLFANSKSFGLASKAEPTILQKNASWSKPPTTKSLGLNFGSMLGQPAAKSRPNPSSAMGLTRANSCYPALAQQIGSFPASAEETALGSGRDYKMEFSSSRGNSMGIAQSARTLSSHAPGTSINPSGSERESRSNSSSVIGLTRAATSNPALVQRRVGAFPASAEETSLGRDYKMEFSSSRGNSIGGSQSARAVISHSLEVPQSDVRSRGHLLQNAASAHAILEQNPSKATSAAPAPMARQYNSSRALNVNENANFQAALKRLGSSSSINSASTAPALSYSGGTGRVPENNAHWNTEQLQRAASVRSTTSGPQWWDRPRTQSSRAISTDPQSHMRALANGMNPTDPNHSLRHGSGSYQGDALQRAALVNSIRSHTSQQRVTSVPPPPHPNEYECNSSVEITPSSSNSGVYRQRRSQSTYITG